MKCSATRRCAALTKAGRNDRLRRGPHESWARTAQGGALISRRRAYALVFALTAALVATLQAGSAHAKQPDPSDRDNFEVYAGTVNPATARRAARMPVSTPRTSPGKPTAPPPRWRRCSPSARLPGWRRRASSWRSSGFGGKAGVASVARAGGGGLGRVPLLQRARRHPRRARRGRRALPELTKLVTIGRTVQGQPILAVKVTKNAKQVAGRHPPVRRSTCGAQHAREWITPGDDPPADAPRARRLRHRPGHHQLVNTTELWFLPVANPDGYDYTFTEGNRLWRKNLRDNNGDGQITAGDGVDPNRNFAYKWGYDNEGSSPDPASDTYRGPARTPSRRPRRSTACSSGSASSSSSTTTRPPSCCSTASAGRSARRRRTT